MKRTHEEGSEKMSLRRSSRRLGFTLMEIMMAVSLIAIFASVADLPVNSFYAGQQAGAEAKIFLSDLRLARYEAIRTGQPHRMVLASLPTSNAYKVQVLDMNVEDNCTIANFNSDANWASVLDDEYRELSPLVNVAASRLSTLYFTPQGRIAENWTLGGELVPMVPNQIDFNYGNATMTLTVNSFGAVSSTEYYEE
mgnify:CR=1 FL=1